MVEHVTSGLLWSVGESLSQHECVCDRVHHADTLRGVRVCGCAHEWLLWADEGPVTPQRLSEFRPE